MMSNGGGNWESEKNFQKSLENLKKTDNYLIGLNLSFNRIFTLTVFAFVFV